MLKFCLLLRLVLFAACSLTLIAGGASALAQGPPSTGAIAGTVADQQGAVIPQALVTITRTDVPGTPVTVMVDSLGQFTAPNLPPGRYSVQADFPNFRPSRKDNILVTANATQRAALNLEIEVHRSETRYTAQMAGT